MRSLIWKECRLNLWVLVLGIGLGLGPYLVGLVWRSLFGLITPGSMAQEMFNDAPGRDLPTWAAWAGLAAAAGMCVWLLERRLRAREVVS